MNSSPKATASTSDSFKIQKGGQSRRLFLTRSGAAAVGFLALDKFERRSAFAKEPSASGVTTRTWTMYRLKCTSAPAQAQGNVAWAAIAAPGSTAQPGYVKLSVTGPAQEFINSSAMPAVNGVFSSSFGTSGSRFSQAKLGTPKKNPPPLPPPGQEVDEDLYYDAYNGGWVEDDKDQPGLYYLTGGAGIPANSPYVNFTVEGTSATAGVGYSGYILDSLVVEEGNQVTNQQTWNTNNQNGFQTAAAAQAALGAGYSGGVSANTDKVGTNHEWKVALDGKFEANGKLTRDEQYAKQTNSSGQTTWNSTGQISSSVSGSIAVQYTIIVQTQTKTVHYTGLEADKTTIIDWDGKKHES